jgi:diguanylate cyclase (GGDEF)-like protein
MTLRQQIAIGTGVLCFVLVAVLATGASLVGREQARKLVAGEMTELARTLAERLDRGLSSRKRDTVLLTELDAMRGIWTGDADDMRAALDQLKRRSADNAWLGFADADGVVKAATGGELEGTSVAGTQWFQRGRYGPIVEDLRDSVPAGSASASDKVAEYIDFASPVHDDAGKLLGVVGMRVSWSWPSGLLESTLAKLDPAKQTELAIVSRHDSVLVGRQIGSTAFPPEQFAAMVEAGAGSFIDHRTASPMFTGFAISAGNRDDPGLGWMVIARRPTAIAMAPVRDIELAIIGLGTFVGLAGMGIAALIAGRVARPIRALTSETDRIGRDPGKLMIRHVQGSVEVTRLSSALRSLIRRLDLTEEEMAAIEQRAAEESLRLSENIDALKELADTDPLTRLPNRRGMARFAEEVIAGYNRDRRPFAALVIDIDRFKAINDTHGHPIGDEVIRHVAELIASTIRPSDRVARFGGEEFVALLGNVQVIRLGDVAERIRAAIESKPARWNGTEIAVTVSIGAAMVGPGDRDFQDVVERADLALYEAKTAGRNRVSIGAAPMQEASAAA